METLIIVVGAFFGTILALFILGVVRYIPNDRAGVVEKLWSFHSSAKSGLIARGAEPGFQARILRGGFHFFTPLQYSVHKIPLVTIPQGQIGYVFARDGEALGPTQALGTNLPGQDFQDALGFLNAGGHRGPQRRILREGTYAINLVQFVILTKERLFYLPLEKGEEELFHNMANMILERQGFEPVVIRGNEDLIGIATVHDGPSLDQDQIIAPTVGCDVTDAATYHNNFQDPEMFLKAGGRRGRQLQVLVDGTYYVNRLFATVELVQKTRIEVGNAGVVISYTGVHGKDLSGVDYKHGELVATGTRGVWDTPLLPGKYAFNTYAGQVIQVPTTNFILKWSKGETGSHKYDENLSEVSLITKDAFEPSLPLSVVVHIDYRKAPLVIQRFGDIKKLVEQTLDPMVSAYFKNIAQTRTLIELIQDRSAIQKQSAEEMKGKFSQYNLELLEVLIGTPTSTQKPGQSASAVNQIEQILNQLRSRQIAEEQVETYSRQQKAAVKERELREAEAKAKQQTSITESELSIMVQANQGKADFARAQQQASQIQALATAESEKIRIIAEGEAKKISSIASAEAERAARVGVAQALAIQEQVRAYGGPKFQLTQEVMGRFAQAIEKARIDVVPKIMLGGGGMGGANGQGGGGQMGSNLIEGLMALLLSEKLSGSDDFVEKPASPEVERIRKEILKVNTTASA